MSSNLGSTLSTSGLNVLQGAETTDLLLAGRTGAKSILSMGPAINVYAIIGAALIFVIVISWFETLRLFTTALYTKNEVSNQLAIVYFIYSMVATALSFIFLYFIFLKLKSNR